MPDGEISSCVANNVVIYVYIFKILPLRDNITVQTRITLLDHATKYCLRFDKPLKVASSLSQLVVAYLFHKAMLSQ